MSLIIRNARVLTLTPGVAPSGISDASACGTRDAAWSATPLRGSLAAELGVIARGDVTIRNGRITSVAAAGSYAGTAREIDADGRVLMPGFIDAHTHALWAGDRLDEWDRKRRGDSYLDILRSGGGIMSTVRAVRAATPGQLAAHLDARLSAMLREGTTTVEVKSGYGLTTPDELKMLRVIAGTRCSPAPTVIPTALIGHAVDPDQPGFVERAIRETLDAVHAEFPGMAVDAYCESGAWTPEQCAALFERASNLGHGFRVHADQFNALGMTQWSVSRGAISVDHLEATPPGALAALARSGTFGVMLPCAGFHTDGRYANGRAFLDAGGALVIATNCNPGSSPCSSMPMAVALGVRHLGITPAEAIAACTRNAACLLGLRDRGVVAPGARADLILLRHRDERMLAYEFGGNPVDAVVLGGEVVAGG